MSNPQDITKFADAIEYAGNNLKITLAERICVMEALKFKWLKDLK